MKHAYSNIGAIPGTAGVWVLPGYLCRRTQVFQKKNSIYGSGTGRVRIGYGLGMGWERVGLNEAKLRCFGKKN